MSETFAIAVIVAVAPTLAAIAGIIVSLRNSEKIRQNSAKMQQIHVMINSRMDELLEISKKASFAAGAKSQKVKKH